MSTHQFLGQGLAPQMMAGTKRDMSASSYGAPRWLEILTVADSGGQKMVTARLDGDVWRGSYDPERDLLFLSDKGTTERR